MIIRFPGRQTMKALILNGAPEGDTSLDQLQAFQALRSEVLGAP